MRAPIVWLILLFIFTGCATARTTPAPRHGAFEQTGEASWYGRQHHGKRTASGEVYDMHQLTAAHRTLPLGTRVLVTNLDNGRTVEVRINDRGPFVARRVLDLSYAAARRLGAVGDGVIPVGLKVLADSAAD
jgi:rare lipoprotein A